MSPRTSEAFENLRTESRRNIMDVAMRLFAERGYHGTSISKIATEAGISKGLLYNYFASKEDLLRALLLAPLEGSASELQALWAAADTPKAQLRLVIESRRDFIKTQERYYRLYLSLALQPASEALIADDVLPAKADSIDAFLHLFEALNYPDPRTEAYYVAATIAGAGLSYLLSPEYPLDAVLDELLRRYDLTTD